MRTRALEGYSNNIQKIRKRIGEYDKIIDNALKEKNHDIVEKYERMVRHNTVMLIDLVDRFDALEMAPPTEALLDKEIELRIAAKNGIETEL